MKLPSSSSVLLATLAISSSSSTLAAPAGEDGTAITTSSSNQHISAFMGGSGIRDLSSADIDIEQRANTTVERSGVDLEEARSEGPTPVFLRLLELLHTLPIIGQPVASLIEKSLPNGADSVEGMLNVSPDDLMALHAAIAEVSRALSVANETAPIVPSPAKSVNETAPTAMSNGYGLVTDSSMSNAFSSASAALSEPTNATSSVSRPFAAAVNGSTTMGGAISTQTPSKPTSAPQSSSPTIPRNPPNSPAPSATG